MNEEREIGDWRFEIRDWRLAIAVIPHRLPESRRFRESGLRLEIRDWRLAIAVIQSLISNN
ncbi:MAG: hypothetical protein M1140_15355 [Chloroflexi bacterium]|nr:hypothetical protein [Chloroflexota bacterium]